MSVLRGKMRTGARISSGFQKLPLISGYSMTRGWPFVVAWCHRIAGLVLVAFVWFHIHTLSSLLTPGSFDAKMRVLRLLPFAILEWALAIPVIFHALNGGRLILYEFYGIRNNEALIRWVVGLTMAYALLVGIMMLTGDQQVSAFFFWFTGLAAGLILTAAGAGRIWAAHGSAGWRLQRISGIFLLAMIPAHLVFMHLNPAMGHASETVLSRMRGGLIRLVDILIVCTVLFHGGYGLFSIAGDYLGPRVLRWLVGLCITAVMGIFAFYGIKLVVMV